MLLTGLFNAGIFDAGPAGAAAAGHFNPTDSHIDQTLGRAGADTGSHFFDYHWHAKGGAAGFDGVEHTAPVAIAVGLHQFLQWIEVNNHGVGLDAVDCALCQFDAMLLQLGGANITEQNCLGCPAAHILGQTLLQCGAL